MEETYNVLRFLVEETYVRRGGMYDKLLPIIQRLLTAGLIIVAIVTDNAGNLIAMHKLLLKKFPGIPRVPCAIHSIQLLITGGVYDHSSSHDDR